MFPRYTILRRIFQVLGTILPNSYYKIYLNDLTIYQGPLKKVPIPSLNCYACPSAFTSCPLGSFQHFIAIKVIPFFIIGFIGTVSLFVGRLPCGWICPFGFFQDLLAKIPTKKLRLPKFLSYFKYVFLIGVAIIIVFLTADPWFCKLCPQGSLQGGIPQVLLHSDLQRLIGGLFWTKIGILFSILVLAVFIKRPFCRTMCPLGAMFSVFQKFSVLQLEVDPSTCDSCEWCERICPVDVNIRENPKDLDCIRCFACTSCESVKITSALIEKESSKKEKLSVQGENK